jgi:hypothetical protein
MMMHAAISLNWINVTHWKKEEEEFRVGKVFFYMVYYLSHYSGNTTSFTIILADIYSYLIILHLICQIVFR